MLIVAQSVQGFQTKEEFEVLPFTGKKAWKGY